MVKNIWIKYLIIIFPFASILLSQHPYISPGIQIGINSNKKLFFSYQVTIGYMPWGGGGVDSNPSSFGTTVGKRFIIGKNLWYKYSYVDVQFWQALYGIGFGKIWDSNGKTSKKIKFGVGGLLLASYDYIPNFKKGRHNYGIFGVIPYLGY